MKQVILTLFRCLLYITFLVFAVVTVATTAGLEPVAVTILAVMTASMLVALGVAIVFWPQKRT